MIIEILFILTATVLIHALVRMLGAILGNGITLARFIPFTDITPARNFLMYPSTMFQVWFWAEHLGVFVS